MSKEILGTMYVGLSEAFQTGLCPIARCVKAEQHDLAVVERIVADMESAILTPKRIDYGKSIRKAYENGEIKESRHNMTELEPRKDGISNTLTTVQEDNLLLEVRQIGNMDEDGETFSDPQCGRAYDDNGLPLALNTMQEGQGEQKIIIAMCGRNPDNPSDRTVGSPTEQRLEPNSQGICNMLTSVQKDNLVLENICINDRGFSEKEPQVSIGTAPTLRAQTHGNLPKVIESQPISTKGRILDVANTILSGYHRTNMTGFNADNGVLTVPPIPHKEIDAEGVREAYGRA